MLSRYPWYTPQHVQPWSNDAGFPGRIHIIPHLGSYQNHIVILYLFLGGILNHSMGLCKFISNPPLTYSKFLTFVSKLLITSTTHELQWGQNTGNRGLVEEHFNKYLEANLHVGSSTMFCLRFFLFFERHLWTSIAMILIYQYGLESIQTHFWHGFRSLSAVELQPEKGSFGIRTTWLGHPVVMWGSGIGSRHMPIGSLAVGLGRLQCQGAWPAAPWKGVVLEGEIVILKRAPFEYPKP